MTLAKSQCTRQYQSTSESGILTFILVGARVQAPILLVFNSLSMMELLRVYSTELSWYGCWPQLEDFYKRHILQESGSLYNLRDITAQQSLFDQLVADTGCTGSPDLIDCLRTVPLEKLMTAVNKSPNAFSFTSVRLGWQPSVDGQIIVRNPQESLQKGLYAKVSSFFFFCSFFAC